MGTPYIFDEEMSCHSTRIELFYLDDNFRRIAKWVPPFSVSMTILRTIAPLVIYSSEIMQTSQRINLWNTSKGSKGKQQQNKATLQNAVIWAKTILFVST